MMLRRRPNSGPLTPRRRKARSKMARPRRSRLFWPVMLSLVLLTIGFVLHMASLFFSNNTSVPPALRTQTRIGSHDQIPGIDATSLDTVEGLDDVNSKLRNPDEIIKWAFQNIASKGKMIQVTSFGPSGLVILHKLSKLGLLERVPVVSIDTLHLFPESNTYLAMVGDFFPNIDLHIFHPKDAEDREEFDQSYGSELWKLNPDKYAYLTKVEPMLRALQELNATAWITGRRRSQGGERSSLNAIDIDETDSHRYKINPLVHWTYEDVWAYIRKHNILYNPLYDLGYKSIGDSMTTQKVSSNAPERSGRFVGLNKTECGMHSHLEKIKRMKQEAEAQGREFEMPTLPCDDCLEVNAGSFDELVLKGSSDMLLEFYSPMCGACQEFSPTFKELAKALKPISAIEVARYDVTESMIPESGVKAGFVLVATPQLYLIQRNPFQVALHEGPTDLNSLLGWLRDTTPYVK